MGTAKGELRTCLSIVGSAGALLGGDSLGLDVAAARVGHFDGNGVRRMVLDRCCESSAQVVPGSEYTGRS